jgi:transposase
MSNAAEISLNQFYPSDSLRITEIINGKSDIVIHLKSITNACRCPACQELSEQYHGTYVRRVQDLPILGKHVQLEITAHEYTCLNPSCEVSTIAETYDGFLNHYSRMTERCAAFIATLALETSCEGCARICKEMGIHISGDSVIRLLLKRFENQSPVECGEVIGIDDFAFKKRNTYGTIIVDEITHMPVAILDGRDGASLREWLKKNKHVKVVTRDRASAYAKVISDELPDVMQIADRFHLHQNLLEAVKGALNRAVPANITIRHEHIEENTSQDAISCKKNGI